MLSRRLSLAAGSEIGPTGAIAIAIVCVLVAMRYSFAAFSASERAKTAWRGHRLGTGPAMSRLGAGGVAVTAYLFAGLLFAHAFGWRAAEALIFRLLFAFVAFTAIVAVRDYARDRERI